MTIHETADSTLVQTHEEAQAYLDLSDQDALAALPEDVQDDLLAEYNEEYAMKEDDYEVAGTVWAMPDAYVDQLDLNHDTGLYDTELIDSFLDHADGDYVLHTNQGTHQTTFTIIELEAPPTPDDDTDE